MRVVIAYGDGVIRGQVKIEGEVPPGNLRMTVSTQRHDTQPGGGRSAEVDSRGRFVIEGLVAGAYELQLTAYPLQRAGATQLRISPVRQQVTVGSGAIEVVMTLELTPKEKKQ